MEIRQQQLELPKQGHLGNLKSSSPASVLSHNKQCEEEENASRLQRWIQDQQLQQDQDDFVLRTEELEAQCTETNSSRSSSPPPPALPLRRPRNEIMTELPATGEVCYPRLEAIGDVDQPPPYESCLEPQSPAFSASSDALLLPHKTSGADVDAHCQTNKDLKALISQSDVLHYPNLDSPTDIAAQSSYATPPQPSSEATPEPEEPQRSPRLQTRKPSPPPIPPKPTFPLSLPLPLPQPPIPTLPTSILTPPLPIPCHFPVPSISPFPITPPRLHFSQPRIFTSHDSRFTVSARLLSWHAGKVHLLKSNGAKIAVPLHKFSGADVEYVLREMMGRAELEGNVERGVGGEAEGTLEVGRCGGEGGIEERLRGELESVYAIV